MNNENKFEFKILPKAVTRLLFTVALLLILAHEAGLVWETFFGTQIGSDLIKKIDLNGEGNVPTWFSSGILLLSAFCLITIFLLKRKRKEPFAFHWIALAFIFIFLSIDETAQLHEWTVAHVHRFANIKFTQYIGWVIPYSIVVVILGVIYLPFFLHLSNCAKVLFGGSGLVYISGALGMEVLTAAIGRVVLDGNLHFLFTATEEILEISGIILFIYALLSYLSWEIDEISIRLQGYSD